MAIVAVPITLVRVIDTIFFITHRPIVFPLGALSFESIVKTVANFIGLWSDIVVAIGTRPGGGREGSSRALCAVYSQIGKVDDPLPLCSRCTRTHVHYLSLVSLISLCKPTVLCACTPSRTSSTRRNPCSPHALKEVGALHNGQMSATFSKSFIQTLRIF